MSQATLEQFTKEVRKCLEQAGKMYNLELAMSRVDIRLDIRGYINAGQACSRRGQYFVRFHPDAIVKHYDEMVKDTVPHEVAHLVCFMRPDLGRNHDKGWKRVCRSLGGDDSRCHNMDFGEKPQREEFWYETTTGHMIDVGPIRHKRIQAGRPYRAKGMGQINKDGFRPSDAQKQRTEQPVKQAARTKQPVKRTVPGSKAERVREYIRGLIEQGVTQEQMLAEATAYALYFVQEFGFGTRGAARQSFVNNVKKLTK